MCIVVTGNVDFLVKWIFGPALAQTGEEIVREIAKKALGRDYDPKLTCHKFRHFFGTRILEETGNLILAQEMLRHKRVGTTQTYGHIRRDELDRRHKEIFSRPGH